jgi:beta-xylosidase
VTHTSARTNEAPRDLPGGEGDTAATDPWRDPSLPVARRVDSLLRAMTLAEKVAQLGSVWLEFGGENISNVAPMQDILAADKSWEDARRDGLGQLTRVFGTAPVSLEAGAARVAELQQDLVTKTRLGIPAIVHEECLTGFTTLGATVYPTALAWAATFNPSLLETMAAAIGRDMAAVGVQQGLSPVLDVVRDYRWGRVEETMGEDPYLVGVMGSAYVRGLQGAGVIATLKHFAGYSVSRAGRNHAPVSLGRREFHDVILPPFEMAIRLAGARSVMNSYADVDGIPAGADRSLLTGLLRDEWGFDGIVVSDYGAITFLHTMHRVAPDLGDAGRQALEAGLDVELPDTICYGDRLVELVESGAVDENLVDRAAARVLRQKVELGMLDPGWSDHLGISADADATFDSPGNRAIARDVAEQSIILLANSGALPLGTGTAAPRRITVVGPCADDPQTFMGCYSYPNHVLGDYPEVGLGLDVPSMLDAVLLEFPDSRISFTKGCDVRGDDSSTIADAVTAAEEADLCVVAVGDRAGLFGRGTSGEGCDALDLALPGVQGQLVDAVLATGTPTVVVVVSGRPYALDPYVDRAAAVVQAFMPGVEGGSALAGVLSGRVAPSGRLPVQIPRTGTGQPSTYLQAPLAIGADGISSLDPTPLFPFGYGLSYTRFEYSNFHVDREVVATDGLVRASVDVANVGDRAGDEVVQLYLTDPVAEVVRPVIQLVGFARVPLPPGKTAHIEFELHADRTAFTGVDLRRVVEPGDINLMIGASADDIRATATFTVSGPRRILGPDPVLMTPVTINDQPQEKTTST